jgi:antitoxin YefM
MESTTVNKFRESLKSYVEQVVTQHLPLRVTRRNGADFVVLSAEDWERDQETLYVLQNSSLMRQIAESSATHNAGTGQVPTKEQLDEILRCSRVDHVLPMRTFANAINACTGISARFSKKRCAATRRLGWESPKRCATI